MITFKFSTDLRDALADRGITLSVEDDEDAVDESTITVTVTGINNPFLV